MTHGSLFSGIGGFDLSAEWAGFTNVFNCENNPFCRQVLKYHFPKAIQYDDIKTTDFTVHKGTIDVVSGGFPCQPFSQAGRRKGEEDDRFLWTEMLRAIREISPQWVIAENVYGITTQQKGMVFERVQTDLEDAGYTVQTFVIPACAVNAPHRRDRVWIIANSTNTRLESVQQKWQNRVSETQYASNTKSNRRNKRRTNCNVKQYNTSKWANISGKFSRFSEKQFVANTELLGRTQDNQSEQTEQFAQNISNWQNFPTVAPVCSRNDGISDRLDGITFPKWRKESLKGFGNAVVPVIPYLLFETIKEIELLTI